MLNCMHALFSRIKTLFDIFRFSFVKLLVKFLKQTSSNISNQMNSITKDKYEIRYASVALMFFCDKLSI